MTFHQKGLQRAQLFLWPVTQVVRDTFCCVLSRKCHTTWTFTTYKVRSHWCLRLSHRHESLGHWALGRYCFFASLIWAGQIWRISFLGSFFQFLSCHSASKLTRYFRLATRILLLYCSSDTLFLYFSSKPCSSHPYSVTILWAVECAMLPVRVVSIFLLRKDLVIQL